MTQKNLLQSAGDGTAIPAGSIGEVVGYYNNSFSLASGSSVFTAAPSITGLSAGIYLVYGFYTISGTGPDGHGYQVTTTPAAPTNQARSYVKNRGFGYLEISQMNIIPTIVRLTGSGSINISIWTSLSSSGTCNLDFQAIRIS